MKTRVLLSHRARRVFIWVHLWLGLILGAWFSLIGITGSVLTWRTELGAWETSRRFPVAKPAANTPTISLSQATSALQKAQPDLDISEVSAVALPGARSSFYSFTLGRNRRTARQVLINPYSAQVLGTVAPRTGTVATIQQIHQRLIAGVRGYVFNGFLTVMAVPLLLSGLWLWWPSNVKQLKARITVKRDAPLHRKIYDWHNVLGIYLYGVLLVTTVTGALLVKNHLDRDGWAKTWEEVKNGEAPPARGESARGESARGERNQGRATRGEGARNGANAPQARGNDAPKVTPQGERLAVDALLQRARQALPQYEITRVQLPQTPDAAFAASYSLPVGFAMGQNLYLNPYNGAVLPSKNREGVNSSQVVRGLHLGDFGGVAVKIIYTLSGLLPLGLFGSGFWLWARKKQRARNKSPRENAAPSVSNPT